MIICPRLKERGSVIDQKKFPFGREKGLFIEGLQDP
jgi:hypothetical protein